MTDFLFYFKYRRGQYVFCGPHLEKWSDWRFWFMVYYPFYSWHSNSSWR